MSLIEVRDLRKVYHVDTERIVALNRINLKIEKGEICCVLGTSGSGKSTLLNIMAGLEKPSLGSVFIDGVDICQLSEKKLGCFPAEKYRLCISVIQSDVNTNCD